MSFQTGGFETPLLFGVCEKEGDGLKVGVHSLEYLESVKKCPTTHKMTEFHGKVFGGLVSLYPVGGGKWGFKCVCGNYCIKYLQAVKRYDSISCGCYKKEKGRLESLFRNMLVAEGTDYKIIKSGSGGQSRDWGLQCVNCLTMTYRGRPQEHLVQGRKFCKCSTHYRKTYQEIKEYVDEFTESSSWQVVSYPDEYTSTNSLRIEVACKKCEHRVNMLYNNLVRGKGCQRCSDIALINRLSKDLSYFIEKSVQKHGDRYDYSKVVYEKCRKSVEIICREHGTFWQSPDNHYNKGKGCPECKKQRLVHVSFHKLRVEENKEVYLSLPSGVYIMRVGDYIKIGLSVTPDKRSKEIRKSSKLPVEVLYYREMDLYNSFKLEYSLHSLYKKFKPEYIDTFQGYTECFMLDDDQVVEAKELIDKWEIIHE